MIPYLDVPPLEIAGLRFHAFGLLAATAIVVGVLLVARRAPRFGVSSDDAFSLATSTVLAGLVGSHVFSELFYFPERIVARPWVLVDLTGSMSAFGGIAGGIAGALATMRWRSLDGRARLVFLDIVAFAFPFSWIFGRLGCSIAHDHPGIRSEHWLAVRFPDGARFDLGLLELFWTIPVVALWLVLDRKRRPDGFYVGLFFVLYGPFRFVMDFLRVDDARYLGWTPSQYVSIAMTIAGGFLLARAVRSSHADSKSG